MFFKRVHQIITNSKLKVRLTKIVDLTKTFKVESTLHIDTALSTLQCIPIIPLVTIELR